MILEERSRGGEIVVFVDGDKFTLFGGFFLEGLVVGGRMVLLMVELHGLVTFGESVALA